MLRAGGEAVPAVGVVVIGRDEGERLVASLESASASGVPVVYVDSGSRDGSVQRARALGVAVLELDPRSPFTAARGRNEGHAFLRSRHPDIEFVQFVDGDTVVAPGWMERAAGLLRADPSLAAVAGRLDEGNAYNRYGRLLQMEWDVPPGETDACGGIAMYASHAFEQIGGFAADLGAGEEPELCARLRSAGYRILRVASPMGVHHGAIGSFDAWWRRAVRCGEAAFECLCRGGWRWAATDARRVVSALLWGGAIPLVLTAALLGFAAGRAPLLAAAALCGGVAVYTAQWLRITRDRCSRGASPEDARLFATFCLIAKPAECLGVARRLRSRILAGDLGSRAREALASAPGRSGGGSD